MKKLLVGTLILSLGTVLSSCGGGQETPKPDSPEKAATSAEKAKPDAGPARKQAPKKAESAQKGKPAVTKKAAQPRIPKLVVASENLLPNGDFEVVKEGFPAGWIPGRGHADFLKSDEEVAALGKHALRVNAPEHKVLSVYRGIDVTPGKTYTFRAWVKGDRPKSAVRLEACVPSAKEPFAASKKTNVTEEWTAVSLEFAAPKNAQKVRALLRFFCPENHEGAVWADGCEVFEMAKPASRNLLRNGDFAAQVNSWKVDKLPADVKCDLSSEKPHAGKACLRLELPADAKLSLINTGFTQKLEPGKRYMLQGFMRSEGLAGESFLRVSAFGEEGHLMGRDSRPISGSQDWTSLSVLFEPPEGAKWMAVRVERPIDEGAEKEGKAGVLWVDDCQVYELPGG